MKPILLLLGLLGLSACGSAGSGHAGICSIGGLSTGMSLEEVVAVAGPPESSSRKDQRHEQLEWRDEKRTLAVELRDGVVESIDLVQRSGATPSRRAILIGETRFASAIETLGEAYVKPLNIECGAEECRIGVGMSCLPEGESQLQFMTTVRDEEARSLTGRRPELRSFIAQWGALVIREARLGR